MRSCMIVLFIAIALTACASNPAATSLQLTPIETVLSIAALPGEPNSRVSARPTWQTLPLINVRTGETFTFADFADKTVFVEPMATWCTNCRQQLGNVSRVKAQLDANQFVFIALSVETTITADDLAQYADDNGFDWLFAVMTPDMLAELAATFGRTITNPPSTPHFMIRPDGTTTELKTGIESDSQILEQLTQINGG